MLPCRHAAPVFYERFMLKDILSFILLSFFRYSMMLMPVVAMPSSLSIVYGVFSAMPAAYISLRLLFTTPMLMLLPLRFTFSHIRALCLLPPLSQRLRRGMARTCA